MAFPKSLTSVVCLLLLGTCLSPISIAAPKSALSLTAITNVTTIDAINGTREAQTVVFKADDIVGVGQSHDPAIAALLTEGIDQVVDGTGKFLIPGLWDFHVHLTYEPGLVDIMPSLFLDYGVTSVRDTGGLLPKLLPVVTAMRIPGARAPRVYFSGPLLDGNDVVYDGVSRPEIGVQNAEAQAVHEVILDLKNAGASFIKIYELVSQEVFAAMVTAARTLEMPIDAHVPLSMRARTAGPLVDSMEHLRNVELDCAANADALHKIRLENLQNNARISGYELRASLHQLQRIDAIKNYSEAECNQTLKALSDTLQVPTLRLNARSVYPPNTRSGWDDALAKIPQDLRSAWRASAIKMTEQIDVDRTFADWSLFLVGRMNAFDVPLGAGTDTPIGLAVPGFSLHSELEMLVTAGLSPLEALGAATVQPARYFKLLDRSGSVDVGKQADLVLLTKNPLLDIRNTKKISMVVSRGKVVYKN